MDDIILCHGSRGGMDGPIQPCSRRKCDFGQAFYMGNREDQAKTLIANDPEPVLYRVKLKLSEFSEDRILQLSGMDWAYYVLYNRQRLESIRGTDLYNKYKHIGDGKDIIIGPIADDAMNTVMRRFVEGKITDVAFFNCIKAIDYGIQYAAKTMEGCSKIEIISERELHGYELTEAVLLSDERRKNGNKKAEEIQKTYRREGRYLDEILNDERDMAHDKQRR